MTEISNRNFGLLIAYVLPGLVALAGLAEHSETVRSWFGASPAETPTVAGFLYVTLASVAAGMTVSAVRWLLLDWLHHHTGIRRPDWDFRALQTNLQAFVAVVENHYRYYQCYSGMLIAVLWYGVAAYPRIVPRLENAGLFTMGIVGFVVVMFLASRDALRKYYSRTEALLPLNLEMERRGIMTNGFDNKKTEGAKKPPAGEVAKKDVAKTKSVTHTPPKKPALQ